MQMITSRRQSSRVDQRVSMIRFGRRIDLSLKAEIVAVLGVGSAGLPSARASTLSV